MNKRKMLIQESNLSGQTLKIKVDLLFTIFLKSDLANFLAILCMLKTGGIPGVFALYASSAVASSETILTNWQFALCGGHNTTGRGSSELNIQTRLRQFRVSWTKKKLATNYFKILFSLMDPLSRVYCAILTTTCVGPYPIRA